MLKLEKRRDIWHISGSLAGKRVRQSTRVPVHHPDGRRMAERIRHDIEQRILARNFDKPVDHTVDAAIQDYVNWKQLEGRLSPDMEKKISKIEAYWSGKMLSDVTSGSVMNYVSDTMTGLKPNSIRRYLNQFRAILKYAEEMYNWKAPKIKMPVVDDARDVHLEADEVNKVLEYFKTKEPKFYMYFLLLFDTGARLSEMLRLQRSDFRGGNVMIRKVNDKNRQKTITRDIPMTADVQAIAERIDPVRGINLWNDPKTASATLNKALKRACLSVGVQPIRVHDCRHTFAYLAAKAGADIADLQHLLGHSDISMTQRYRGYVQSRARSVVLSSRTQLGYV